MGKKSDFNEVLSSCSNACWVDGREGLKLIIQLFKKKQDLMEICVLSCCEFPKKRSGSSCSCITVFGDDNDQCLLLCGCISLKLYNFCSAFLRNSFMISKAIKFQINEDNLLLINKNEKLFGLLQTATRLLLRFNPKHRSSWKLRLIFWKIQNLPNEVKLIEDELKLYPNCGECWNVRKILICNYIRISHSSSSFAELKKINGETFCQINHHNSQSGYLISSIFLQEIDFIQRHLAFSQYSYFAINYLIWLINLEKKAILNHLSVTTRRICGVYAETDAKKSQEIEKIDPFEVFWNRFSLFLIKKFIGTQPLHYGPYNLFIHNFFIDIKNALCTFNQKFLAGCISTGSCIDLLINCFKSQFVEHMDFCYRILDLFPSFDSPWTFRSSLINAYTEFIILILHLKTNKKPENYGFVNLKLVFTPQLQIMISKNSIDLINKVKSEILTLLLNEVRTMQLWRRGNFNERLNHEIDPKNIANYRFSKAPAYVSIYAADDFKQYCCRHEFRCYDEFNLTVQHLIEFIAGYEIEDYTSSKMNEILSNIKAKIDQLVSYGIDLMNCTKGDEEITNYISNHPHALRVFRQLSCAGNA